MVIQNHADTEPCGMTLYLHGFVSAWFCIIILHTTHMLCPVQRKR